MYSNTTLSSGDSIYLKYPLWLAAREQLAKEFKEASELTREAEEDGLLTEYLKHNTEKIEEIKEKLLATERLLKKIGFFSLMAKDPIIDNPENLTQLAMYQNAELELINSHIDTVIEFLKATV